MTDRELMQMALDALGGASEFLTQKMQEDAWKMQDLLSDRLAQPEPEPVAGLLETIELIGSHSEEYEAGFWDGLRAFEAKLKEKNT